MAATRAQIEAFRQAFGLDPEACIRTAFDLGYLVGECDREAEYAKGHYRAPSRRELWLRRRNDQLREEARKAVSVNACLAAILMEEHALLTGGSWLARCIEAAEKAHDGELLKRLKRLQEDIGPRRKPKRRKRRRKGVVTMP